MNNTKSTGYGRGVAHPYPHIDARIVLFEQQ